MDRLNGGELSFINAGALSVRGNVFTVTDGSIINFGGIKFTTIGICQNDICSDEIFKTPLDYQFKNPDGTFIISGEYIENGAIYYLSAATELKAQ